MSSTTVIEKKTKSGKDVRNTFPVLEMSCAACAVSVESILKSVAGVKDAGVNFANESAWVEYDEQLANPADLQHAVQSIGYDLVVDADDPAAAQEEAQRKQYEEIKVRTLWSAILAAPVLIIGMFFMDMPYGNYISMILATPVVFYFGRTFFIHAWRQAKMGKANMDTLVALSTGIAYLFSAFNTIFPGFWHARGMQAHVYFEAAAVVVAFISLGKLLEEKAKSNTSSAIKKLMGLQPKTVIVVKDGIEQVRPISTVSVGDIILVKPGERIPVDGVVTLGSSFVDESMISGEPIAVEKIPSEKVFAGTVNQKGSFQFRAEKVGANTILAHIIQMVREAQGSKAPVQKLVDKIAGVFVPIVIGISILTFITWMIFGGDGAFTHALLTSVTVLVIACPCALGLATPTAIMVGVGKGAENNILIKDAESLELAHTVNNLILDKTGTITEGKPVATDLIWTPMGKPEAVQFGNILLSLEGMSEHPLADAIVNRMKDEGATSMLLENFESIIGQGVTAESQGEKFYAGNRKFVDEMKIRLPEEMVNLADTLQAEAKTVIYFFNKRELLALVAITDKIKATSATAIKQLMDLGITVHMLTGDNKETARTVASQVGITSYRAEVQPVDKAEFIKELQNEGKIVAMVGDGINDSLALAQADVSIAMGKGSDIAMDVAKMTLITSDLQLIAKALVLSKKTVRGIHQNLFWAFVYNVIGIPVAAGILYPINGFLLNPMIAGAAMALSSVSVVSNSLRLRYASLVGEG